MKLNHIFTGDCLQVLAKAISDDVVDIVYADPPYNASRTKLSLVNNGTGGPYHKVHEAWDQHSDEEYWDMTRLWVGEARRV